ncbi:hypothetical protein Q3G72_016476 [Acer saccharum]|nr:hypothetical protein Q3G72_016476 [Acer saccharum]
MESSSDGAGRMYGRNEQRTGFQGNRSYAEILTRNQKEVWGRGIPDVDELVCMKWDGPQPSTGWLSKCAMGTLKTFSNISSVNQRLILRGFTFSSQFLGDKTIIWQFDSETDCIGFIKNRFFWDDCFTSMEKCPQDVVAKSRLAWIDVYGVPLNCWHDAFFMRVGRSMGIPLMLEEDTMKKSRLDRGRVLISIPLDGKCMEKIKVQFRSRLFELSIVEEKAQVDRGWIRNFLGLRYGDLDSNSNSSSESERNGNPSVKVGARVPECQPITATSDKSHTYGMGCHNLKTYRTKGEKAFHNSRLGSKEEAKKATDSFPFQTKERYFESASVVREASEKGKKV